MSSATTLSQPGHSQVPAQIPHLFEFMDLDWLPVSLRNVLREILECGNAKPFRPYYDSAAAIASETATKTGSDHIVELGAGTAPLTRRLAAEGRDRKLTVCDFNPDETTYRELQSEYPESVHPIYESVDFSKHREWPPGTLLVLSATLHHLPREAREQTLKAMTSSADAVLVIEPLRRTISSLLFVLLSAIPAVILPIWFLGRPNRWQRFLWCWLIPVAPLMFLWDGWMSCLRQWPDQDYRDWADKCDVNADVSHQLFTQIISLQRKNA